MENQNNHTNPLLILSKRKKLVVDALHSGDWTDVEQFDKIYGKPTPWDGNISFAQ